MTDRCPDCERPLATQSDHDRCPSGCERECCTSLCWRAWDVECPWSRAGHGVDWRTRALAAEATTAALATLEQRVADLEQRLAKAERYIEHVVKWGTF